MQENKKKSLLNDRAYFNTNLCYVCKCDRICQLREREREEGREGKRERGTERYGGREREREGERGKEREREGEREKGLLYVSAYDTL